MYLKIESYKQNKVSKEKLLEIFQGWNAYAKWADPFNLRKMVVMKIYSSANPQSIYTLESIYPNKIKNIHGQM